MGNFLKFCSRQQIFAVLDFYMKTKIVQYFKNYKYGGVNQGHFRNLLQVSTNATKNNLK